MKAVLDKSWTYLKRAHMHAASLGATAGLCSLVFWMLVGFRAPRMGAPVQRGRSQGGLTRRKPLSQSRLVVSRLLEKLRRTRDHPLTHYGIIAKIGFDATADFFFFRLLRRIGMEWNDPNPTDGWLGLYSCWSAEISRTGGNGQRPVRRNGNAVSGIPGPLGWFLGNRGRDYGLARPPDSGRCDSADCRYDRGDHDHQGARLSRRRLAARITLRQARCLALARFNLPTNCRRGEVRRGSNFEEINPTGALPPRRVSQSTFVAKRCRNQ